MASALRALATPLRALAQPAKNALTTVRIITERKAEKALEGFLEARTVKVTKVPLQGKAAHLDEKDAARIRAMEFRPFDR